VSDATRADARCETGDAPAGGAEPLLVFPCNGNAIEALDCLGRRWRMLGFVDDTSEKQASVIHGHPVYTRAAFERWPDASVLAVPGGPSSYRGRAALIARLAVPTHRFARVIHPSARISPLAVLGCNVLIMAGTVVTSNAVIGDHVCILPNTVVHHDASVGAGTLIGSNVTIAGGVVIEETAYIGSGTSVKNGVRIGAGALVGLGSVVVRNVAAGTVVAGNPARALRESAPEPTPEGR